MSPWQKSAQISGSYIWQITRRLAPFLQLGSHWLVVDGSRISLSFDKWCSDFSLVNLVPHLAAPVYQLVSSIISDGRLAVPQDWPVEILEIIGSLHKSQVPAQVTDELIWKHTSSSYLSLKLAWEHVQARSTKK